MVPSYGDFWSGMGEVTAWGKEGAGVGGCCGGVAAGNLFRRGFSYRSVDRLELYKSTGNVRFVGMPSSV